MLSFLSSVPSWAVSLFSNHLEFILGYGFCVLFPMPWLNSWIISMWKKLLAAEASSNTTPPTTPPAA